MKRLVLAFFLGLTVVQLGAYARYILSSLYFPPELPRVSPRGGMFYQGVNDTIDFLDQIDWFSRGLSVTIISIGVWIVYAYALDNK